MQRNYFQIINIEKKKIGYLLMLFLFFNFILINGLFAGSNEKIHNYIVNAPEPYCQNLISPLDGDTDVSADVTITWSFGNFQHGYKLLVGTISGGGDILDSLDVGNVDTFDLVGLPYSQTIYVTIIPYSSGWGDISCTEESFVVEAAPVAAAFITTWQTTTANESIIIPTTGSGYNYDVDWGDGTSTSGHVSDASHNYTMEGDYQVSITGDFPRIFFNNTGDKHKIISIDQWGDQVWSSMNRAFYGCTNLVGQATDNPNLSLATDLYAMFFGASSYNEDIGDWDVSNIENMSFMFYGTPFNQDIGGWNVNNVTDMSTMFWLATNFNQDISAWDISNVTNMQSMFQDAFAYNQDLSNWNTSNVTNMFGMFYNATSFDQDISAWNVENVTTMGAMFGQTTLSTENYDAILNNWSTQNLQSNVSFDGGNSTYCDGAAAREDMVTINGWTIMDGGEDPACTFPAILDLALKLEVVSLEPYIPGDTIDYLITVINQGNQDAIQVRIKDYLPIGLSYNDSYNPGWNNGEKTLYSINAASSKTTPIRMVMEQDFSPSEYINLAEIMWVMEPTLEEIVYGDIDSDFDDNPDNDAGGAPDTPSDNAVDGDGTGIPGDTNPSTDEDDSDPAMLIPFEDCTGELYFTSDCIDGQTDKVYVMSLVEANLGKPSTEPMDIVVNNNGFSFVNTLSPFQSSSSVLLGNIDLNIPGVYPVTLDSAASTDGYCIANGNTPIYTTSLEVVDYPTFSFGVICGDGNTTVSILLGSGEIINDYTFYGEFNIGGEYFDFEILGQGQLVGDTLFQGNVISGEEEFGSIVILDCNEDSIQVDNMIADPCYISGPSCTYISSPMNQQVDVAPNAIINWDPVSEATGFYVQMGNCQDCSNIFDNLDNGNNTTIQPGTPFAFGDTIYVTITPYNDNGDAMDCQEEWFVVESPHLYVDQSALGDNNGTSWNNAFLKLRDAVSQAQSGDTIFVAEGTYFPDEGVGATDNDRNSTFAIKSGVSLYGGFPSGGDIFENRDWKNYLTILSGEIQQDGDTTNNANSIITTNNLYSTVTVDGVIVKLGYCTDNTTSPNGSGAGWYNYGSASGTTFSSLIRNCTFEFNRAYSGGAITNSSTFSSQNMVVENCIFKNNLAKWGGAVMYNRASGGSNRTVKSSFTNCSFNDNRTFEYQFGNGGVIYNYGNSSATAVSNFLSCEFKNNSAAYYGGVAYNSIYNNGKASANFENCIMLGNIAKKGGVLYGGNVESNVTNCSFYGNSTLDNHGSSIYSYSHLKNSIFWSDNDTIIHVSGSATLSNCIYEDDNEDGILLLGTNVIDGGANFDSNPFYFDAIGGELGIANCSPAIDGGNNSASSSIKDFVGNPRVFNNVIDIGAYESQSVLCNTQCVYLNNPLDNDLGVSVELDLEWEHAQSASGYVLYIGTSSNGSDIIDSLDVGYTETYDLEILSPNTTYFVRIYPYNSLGILDNCTEESFTTGEMPPPVNCTNLLAPLHETIEVSNEITIEWAIDDNATSYNLSIGTDINATNIIDNMNVGNVTSWMPDSLNYGDTIYIKVVPQNASGLAQDCSVEWFVVQEYCEAASISSYFNFYHITSVSFDSITNVSSGEHYTYFSDFNLTAIKDSIYDIAIEGSGDIGIWIDFNHNNNFDNDELVFSSDSYNPNGTITIPNSSLTGITRLRIVANSSLPYNETLQPCGTFYYGEVEDYVIDIFALPPVPGCIDATAHNYNPNATQDDDTCETCTDGVLNGDETEVDCGGTLCNPCPCTHPDFAALMALYNSTDGPNWTNNTGWIDGADGTDCDPCNWYGVSCNGNGRVIGINLDNYNMTAEGTLPEELSDLDMLASLTMRRCNLTDPLPQSMANLTNLTYLALDNNNLTLLPESIGSMTQLTTLLLYKNDLLLLPDTICNLTNVSHLRLDLNDIAGEIPSCIGEMQSLTSLNLARNELVGSIPESFGLLGNLQYCLVLGNNLTGEIPSSIGNLSQIGTLNLSENNLSGCFPSELQNICGASTNFSNNPNLPGGGDFDAFCSTGAGACSPPCTTLSTPMDGDTITDLDLDLTWDTALGATGYKLLVGTSSGSGDVLDSLDVSDVTTYDPGTWANYSTYFVTIIPYNVNGEANGCMEEFFVTNNECLEPPLPDCSSLQTITIDAELNMCSADTSITPPIADDLCDGDITGVGSRDDNAAMTDPWPVGTTKVTWTFSDNDGNSTLCTQDVTIIDSQYPSIVCPSNVYTSSNPGSCYATGVYIGMPTTSDNCSSTIVVNNAPGSYAVGQTVVTWTATDASGNAVQCTQTVNVTDDTNPSIGCPADIIVEANNTEGDEASGVNLGNPTTSDNCSVGSPYNNAAEPYLVGDNYVTWYVTDGAGNIDSCIQTVTVIPPNPNILDYSISLGNHVVNPLEGTPYTVFKFEVEYTNENGDMPEFGFPRTLLDYEGDGIYTGSNDHTLIMLPVDENDIDVTDGKDYYVEVIGLEEGGDWKTLFQNVSGYYTTNFGPFDEPTVFDPLDISIFSSDISFSNSNPGPGDPITVTATIHNTSSFDANNFECRLYNEYDGTTYPDITGVSLASGMNTQVSWNINAPAEEAFVPMRVYIDINDVLVENNELDNNAVRPFITGTWTNNGGSGGGALEVIADLEILGDSTIVSGNAYYTGDLFPDGTKVSGGEVNFTISTTGNTYTTTTNSIGDFTYKIASPGGSYIVDGTVTDFTLVGDFAIEPCYQDLTSSVDILGGSVFDNSLYGLLGQSYSVQLTTVNNGCLDIEDVTTTTISSSGILSSSSYAVDLLEPGASETVTTNVVFSTLGYNSVSSEADANDETFENSETNNGSSQGIIILDTIPDIELIDIVVEPGIDRCGGTTNILFANSSGVNTGPFIVRIIKSKDGVVLNTSDISVSNVPLFSENSISFSDEFEMTGTHVYEVIVDPDNLLMESDETNNSDTQGFNVNLCPVDHTDLKISGCSAYSVGPLDPHLGSEISLDATVKNTGDLDVFEDVVVAFIIDTDTSFVTIPGGVESGESINVGTNMNSPTNFTGDYEVIVDPYDVIGENNESNNIYTDILGYDFDLAVPCENVDMFWEKTYLINEQVNMYVKLHNWLMYPASSVEVSYEVISGPGITTPVPLGSANVGNVRKNCDYCSGYFAVLPYPTAFPQGGVYTIKISADPQGEYPESNESNNDMIVDITIVNIPDYATTSSYINPSLLNPDFNEDVTFDVSYTNLGQTNLDSFNVKLEIDNVAHQSKRVGGLSSGDLATVHFDMPYSSNVQGTHVVHITVDADVEILEENEDNNEAIRTFIVGAAPNLFTDTLYTDNLNPSIGDSINFMADIVNEGGLTSTFDYNMIYIDNQGDTILISSQIITLDSEDTTSISVPWIVGMEQATIYAIIENSSPLEYNHQDNVTSITLNGFSIELFITDVSCGGSIDGMITTSVTGGVSPYNYIWSNGATTDDISMIGMGEYSLIVVDSAGMVSYAEGEVFNGDVTPPIIIIPGDTIINMSSDCMTAYDPIYDIPISISDNCTGEVSIDVDYDLPFTLGETIVTYTATDVAGNVSIVNRSLTFVDISPPVIVCPDTVFVNTDSGMCSASEIELEEPFAFDNCSDVMITYDSPELFNIGANIVTWVATDEAENSANCQQIVVVIDEELPIITCHSDTVLYLEEGSCIIESFSLDIPAITDNCGVDTVYNDAPITIDKGDHSIIWTVIDIHENVNSCEVLITVLDTFSPVITCLDTLFITTDLGQCSTSNIDIGTPTVLDNCEGDIVLSHNAVEPYNIGYTTVVWTATDESNNAATCNQVIVVSDNEAPEVLCPVGPIVVYPDEGQDFYTVVNTEFDPIVSDNCSYTLINDYNDAATLSGEQLDVGEHTIIWTATDPSGNISTCTLEINVSGDDFYISGQTISLSEVMPGDQLTISCAQNYSGGSSETLYPYVGYYFSIDDIWDSGDTWLGHDNSSLKSTDLWDTESATISIPTSIPTGDYFILFKADYQYDYIESDESNNVVGVAISVLDLDETNDFFVVSTSLSDEEVEVGEEFIASSMQAYNGNSVQTLYSYLGYYLSSDQVWDSNDILLDTDVSSLSISDTQDGESETLTIPDGTAPGDYYILFVADHLDSFEEDDEENNIVFEPISISSGGSSSDDFTVGLPTISSSEVDAGDMITIQCQQIYTGSTSNSLYPMVGYYLSEDDVWDDSDVLLGQDVSSISTMDYFDWENENVVIPSDQITGDYYVIFVADHTHLYTETNEDNNTLALAISITGDTDTSDDDIFLTDYSASVTEIELSGQTDLLVKQQYSGTTNTTLYPRVGYFISSDTIWDTDDFLVGYDVSSISAADTYDWESATIAIPAYTPVGTNYILFIADYTSLVSESDEDNNLKYIEITVVEPIAMESFDEGISSIDDSMPQLISSSIEQSFDDKMTIVLTPNPASDRVQIELPMADEKKGEMVIYNLQGAVIHIVSTTAREKDESQYVIQVDVKHWNKGMYFVKYTQENGASFISKLIVLK